MRAAVFTAEDVLEELQDHIDYLQSIVREYGEDLVKQIMTIVKTAESGSRLNQSGELQGGAHRFECVCIKLAALQHLQLSLKTYGGAE